MGGSAVKLARTREVGKGRAQQRGSTRNMKTNGVLGCGPIPTVGLDSNTLSLLKLKL